jgi:6-phosphogluconolactonase (cycloisomerase 2 family)
VGCYTPNGWEFTCSGESNEIHLDQAHNTGIPADQQSATNPSWLAFDPAKKFLYAAMRSAIKQHAFGAVSAFSINQANGDWTFLNSMSSGAAVP